MTRAPLPFLLAAALVAAASPAAAEVVAIEGGVVHTRPGTVLEGATVVLDGGVVRAVGVDVPVSAGARRVDARGKVVTAGLVDAATRLGLVEVNAVEDTVEGRFNGESGDPVHAAYRVTDGYNPHAVTIPIARAGGVTSAIAVPSGGLVSGTGAWMALGDGTASSLAIAAPVGLYLTLGREARGAAEGSRGVAVERLRELFDDARLYGRTKGRYERNQSRRLAAERLDLEAILDTVRARRPLVVRAHRASDILAALRLGDEVGLPVVIQGGTEAWMVADELLAARAAVILNPMYNLPSSFDRIHVRDDVATILVARGVPVALSSLGEASGVRTLRQVAGVAVAHGLTWAQALAAVTTVPARIFGAPARGTLERGAPADVVVWSGDPFELSTRVEAVFVGGAEQSLDNHQTRLLERYRDL